MRGQIVNTLAVTLALAMGTFPSMPPAHATPAPGPGPAFTLEGLDGKPVSLAAYKGSPVILLFWAPW